MEDNTNLQTQQPLPDQPGYRVDKKADPSNPFICSFTSCNRTFQSKGQIQEHLSKDHGFKAYLCSICQKGFSKESALKVHMHSHSKERTYECNYKDCQMTFYTKSGLKYHLLKHKDEDFRDSRASDTERSLYLYGDLDRKDYSSNSGNDQYEGKSDTMNSTTSGCEPRIVKKIPSPVQKEPINIWQKIENGSQSNPSHDGATNAPSRRDRNHNEDSFNQDDSQPDAQGPTIIRQADEKNSSKNNFDDLLFNILDEIPPIPTSKLQGQQIEEEQAGANGVSGQQNLGPLSVNKKFQFLNQNNQLPFESPRNFQNSVNHAQSFGNGNDRQIFNFQQPEDKDANLDSRNVDYENKLIELRRKIQDYEARDARPAQKSNSNAYPYQKNFQTPDHRSKFDVVSVHDYADYDHGNAPTMNHGLKVEDEFEHQGHHNGASRNSHNNNLNKQFSYLQSTNNQSNVNNNSHFKNYQEQQPVQTPSKNTHPIFAHLSQNASSNPKNNSSNNSYQPPVNSSPKISMSSSDLMKLMMLTKQEPQFQLNSQQNQQEYSQSEPSIRSEQNTSRSHQKEFKTFRIYHNGILFETLDPRLKIPSSEVAKRSISIVHKEVLYKMVPVAFQDKYKAALQASNTPLSTPHSVEDQKMRDMERYLSEERQSKQASNSKSKKELDLDTIKALIAPRLEQYDLVMRENDILRKQLDESRKIIGFLQQKLFGLDDGEKTNNNSVQKRN